MDKIIFVKFGGSLITDKRKEKLERIGVIKRLARESVRAQKRMGFKILMGNGGGSYSHPPSKKFNVPSGVESEASLIGISEVQDTSSQLNRIVVRELINAGCRAVSMNPSSFMMTTDFEISSAYTAPLIHALELGMIPVVYGDVIFDTERGCSDISTEKIFTYLVKDLYKQFEVVRVIYCGTTNGVYGGNGETISEITKSNFNDVRLHVGESSGIDVTGGMLHKVKQCLQLAEVGVESVIINGNKPDNLYKVLVGKRIRSTIIK